MCPNSRPGVKEKQKRVKKYLAIQDKYISEKYREASQLISRANLCAKIVNQGMSPKILQVKKSTWHLDLNLHFPSFFVVIFSPLLKSFLGPSFVVLTD